MSQIGKWQKNGGGGTGNGGGFNRIEIGLNVKHERRFAEKNNKNKFLQFAETESVMHLLKNG